MALEKTLESPLDCIEIKSVSPKVNKPLIFTGRTDAEAGAPVFWSSGVNRQLIGKSLMLERLRAEGEEDVRG